MCIFLVYYCMYIYVCKRKEKEIWTVFNHSLYYFSIYNFTVCSPSFLHFFLVSISINHVDLTRSMRPSRATIPWIGDVTTVPSGAAERLRWARNWNVPIMLDRWKIWIVGDNVLYYYAIFRKKMQKTMAIMSIPIGSMYGLYMLTKLGFLLMVNGKPYVPYIRILRVMLFLRIISGNKFCNVPIVFNL